MSIDLKFVEVTADVLEIFFIKYIVVLFFSKSVFGRGLENTPLEPPKMSHILTSCDFAPKRVPQKISRILSSSNFAPKRVSSGEAVSLPYTKLK